MRYLTLILFLILFANAGAQQYYNDAQVRFNLGLEKKITKKLSITLDQQDRWTKNVSEFNRASLDVGIMYKINKHIRIKADYVYIQKRATRGHFNQRNWYYIAMTLKGEKGKFKFFYRNLLQARMGSVNSDEKNVLRIYDRNKFTIRHETTRRYFFWVAEELYIPLNSPQAKGIDRTRTFLGMTIVTFKNQEVDLYFMYQAFLQRNKWFDQEYAYPTQLPRRDFIYGINYSITF